MCCRAHHVRLLFDAVWRVIKYADVIIIITSAYIAQFSELRSVSLRFKEKKNENKNTQQFFKSM